jgi:hypothetical protein
MHWPPPKRLSPTPGKRGAKYSFRACDGSVNETLSLRIIGINDFRHGQCHLVARNIRRQQPAFHFGAPRADRTTAFGRPWRPRLRVCSVAPAAIKRTTAGRRENSDGSRSAMTPPPAKKRRR